MSRKNRVQSVKIPFLLYSSLNHVLEQLAMRGLLGKNKAEVARAILWDWVWDNEEKLRRQGVRLGENGMNLARKGGKLGFHRSKSKKFLGNQQCGRSHVRFDSHPGYALSRRFGGF